jgi:hypothetical protein
MAKQTMSEIIAAYNNLALQNGVDQVDSFKNLQAARAALKSLESKPMNDFDETPSTSAADSLEAPSNGGPKYNSSGKRGPTQGIGAFCKGLITEGKTNVEILIAVAENFPTAKTTANCVAYYRAKMALAAKKADELVAEEFEA